MSAKATMRIAPTITLSDDNEKQLKQWARGRSTAVRLAQRAQIVLRAAAGEQNKLIAEELGVTQATVGRWRNRFAAQGLPGIEKENIDLSITKDTVVLKGEIKKEEETKEENYYLCERSQGSSQGP